MKVTFNLSNPFTMPRQKYIEAKLPDKTPVIYFLFFKGSLVYVGITDNRLPGRLDDHRLGKNTTHKKKFDEIAFTGEHSPRNRRIKEILYIFKYKPKYNAREWGKYWDETI